MILKEQTAAQLLKIKNFEKQGYSKTTAADYASKKSGKEYVTVDKKVAQANEIAGGVAIKKINPGALQKSRIQEGFIVMSVNGQEVKTADDFTAAVKGAKGTIYLDGIYPGYSESYRYPVKLDDE